MFCERMAGGYDGEKVQGERDDGEMTDVEKGPRELIPPLIIMTPILS